MVNENVIICGVIKNVENRIKQNIHRAIKTGKQFKKYHIIIYENNSTDNTKKILNNIAYKHVKIMSEDLTEKDIMELRKKHNDTFKSEVTRIEQICFARNKILEEINKEEYKNFNYVIWIDLDAQSWSINGIVDSFHKKDIWDVIYANSHRKYYDYFALRLHCNTVFNLGPEILGELWWKEANNRQLQFNPHTPYQPRIRTRNIISKNKRQLKKKYNITFEYLKNTEKTKGLLPVLSAFNGIGIFKKDIFSNFFYHYLINEDVKHIYRNHVLPNVYKKYKQYIENKDALFINEEKDTLSNIVWKYREGNKPIICEHVAMNFSLLKHGYTLFINPNMKYKPYKSLKEIMMSMLHILHVIKNKALMLISKKHIHK